MFRVFGFMMVLYGFQMFWEAFVGLCKGFKSLIGPDRVFQGGSAGVKPKPCKPGLQGCLHGLKRLQD